MKSQREKIIQNYFSPQAQFDIEDLYGWLSHHIIVRETDGLPWSGTYYGLTGISDYMINVTRHIISEIQIDDVYTSGDKVVAIGKSVGKVVKKGTPFKIRLVMIFTFNKEDKIKKVEFLADLPAFLEALEENITSTEENA